MIQNARFYLCMALKLFCDCTFGVKTMSLPNICICDINCFERHLIILPKFVNNYMLIDFNIWSYMVSMELLG